MTYDPAVVKDLMGVGFSPFQATKLGEQLYAGGAAFTGDSGSGGAAGLVPAPAAGDAAASKFLAASGIWAATPGALFINVQAYGATGNGTTNDTTAVNAAITAAGSGGTDFFPNGTYKLSGITLSASVKIVGASQAGTILKLGSASTHFINLAASGIELESLTVDANSLADDAIYGTAGYSNIAIRRVTAKNAKCGVHPHDISNLIIDGCSIVLNTSFQIFYEYATAVKNVTITNNYIDPQGASTGYSIYVALWVSGSSAPGSGNLKNVLIEGNIVQYQLQNAVESDGIVVSSISLLSNVVVNGNNVVMTAGTAGSGFAIEVEDTANAVVTNNTIAINDNASNQVGIYVGKHSSGIAASGVVSGNTIISTSTAGGTGIQADSYPWAITGNYIEGCGVCIVCNDNGQSVIGNIIKLSLAASVGLKYHVSGGSGATISHNTFFAQALNNSIGIITDGANTQNLLCDGNILANLSIGYWFQGATYSGDAILNNKFSNVTEHYHTLPASGVLILETTAAGMLNIGATGNGGVALGYTTYKPLTYATLPSSPAFGMRACITDSNTADTSLTYGMTVTATVSGGASAYIKYIGGAWVIG